jgi:hypothetical protein
VDRRSARGRRTRQVNSGASHQRCASSVLRGVSGCNITEGERSFDPSLNGQFPAGAHRHLPWTRWEQPTIRNSQGHRGRESENPRIRESENPRIREFFVKIVRQTLACVADSAAYSGDTVLSLVSSALERSSPLSSVVSTQPTIHVFNSMPELRSVTAADQRHPARIALSTAPSRSWERLRLHPCRRSRD